MANTIRIKRRAAGGASGAPASLLNAELAYNEQDNVLYYGYGVSGGTSAQNISIAGPGAFTTLSTAQSITAVKTFTVSPLVPTVGTSDSTTAAASTAYVKSVLPTVSAGTGITVATTGTVPNSAISITNTAVTAGSYGSSTAIPTFTVNAQGQLTAASSVGITVGDGALTLGIGTAAATATTVTIGTGTGFTANDSTAVTYDIKVGPALTALASTMTGASSGFVKKTAADTYSIDSTVYLTSGTGVSSWAGGTTGLLPSAATTGAITVTGTLVVANGGTGTTNGSITGTGALTYTAGGTNTNINLVPNGTGVVDVASKKITNVATPTADTDAANKLYVDAMSQGLSVKDAVRAATTANITLSAPQTIDGVILVAGNRILVKNQTAGAENGLYLVAAAGWTRTVDADAPNEMSGGDFVFVQEGTTNADSGWVCTNDGAVTIGTTALTFAQFSGAGQILAGAGLTKTGNTIDVIGTTNRILVNADSIDIASNYVGQTSITTLGTVTTGVWNATVVTVPYGGTGVATITGIVKGNGTSAFTAAVDGTDFLGINTTIDGGTF